jgi:hypothetical protein
MPMVDLVFFEGCPHVEEARNHIRTALQRTGAGPSWHEWDTSQSTTPSDLRGYGSPTVLVDGKDVSGTPPGNGMRCVIGGAPAVDLIVEALLQGKQ